MCIRWCVLSSQARLRISKLHARLSCCWQLPCLNFNLQAELEDQVQISTSFEDLCDQNVIVYLLRTKSKQYTPQVL